MNDSRYYQRTIVKDELPSSFLGLNRKLRIYLPPGYNELLSYPVIYCQDGEQFFNFGRIATTITRCILEADLEPTIIVGVDVDNEVRTSEYAPDGELHKAYTRFFAEELIPYVENRYPIRSDRTERIVAGDSLGGTVSLHLALDYSSLFCRVISLSGAFFEATRERLKAVEDLSWLELYMLVGLDETDVKTERGSFDFVRENRATKEILESKHTALHYLEKPGKHLWGFWQGELEDALRYFLT